MLKHPDNFIIRCHSYVDLVARFIGFWTSQCVNWLQKGVLEEIKLGYDFPYGKEFKTDTDR